MFSIKINDIQKQRLATVEYEDIVLQATPHEKPQIHSNEVFMKKKNDTAVINSDGNTYEIVVISNNFEEEKIIAADTEFEEYELLEVDHLDANTESLESQDDQQVKQLQSDEITLFDVNDIDEDTENEPKKSYQINTRQKQRSNIEQIKKRNINTKERTHGMAKLQLSALAATVRRRSKLSMRKGKRENCSTIQTNQDEDCDMEQMQQDCDDIAEGKSDNEFPARDSDNEDWPSSNTLGEFPTEIIKDGLLLIKGKELMSIICRYETFFRFEIQSYSNHCSHLYL